MKKTMHFSQVKRDTHKRLSGLALGAIAGSAISVSTKVAAQDAPSVVIGKNNDWLFTRYEFADQSDAADTQATISLLEKANAMFQAKGIAVAVAVVPSKIRIHADQLPSDKPLDSYTANKYDNIAKKLASGGVSVVNLNDAFLNSAHRASDTPIYLRLDTHWSHTGAMVAAETIKSSIQANPKLKAALDATPEEKFEGTWSKQKVNQRARDLVRLLPNNPSYPIEQAPTFKAARVKESQAGLLGDDSVGITVIGSSYTNKNTSYPDALRFVLQRELLDISIPVDQGPWVGMEAYLKDDAFKTRKPKLIIWEIPEREFRSPPNYKFRDARYQMDNNAWLEKISALLKQS
jgi:alginate O-acetyltransferase complex protein AlgJ